jgi:hypothetical protein
MAASDVRKSKKDPTQYAAFEIKREQVEGLTGEGTKSAYTGRSPLTRWIARAFDYDDFVSNVDATGWVVKNPLPPNSLVLRAIMRVETAFEASGPAADVDVGHGGTPGANPGDGWGDGLDLTSTGAVCDPDSDFNPAGANGPRFYDEDTVDVYWQNATAPTAGEAILFLEVISYHEDLGEEVT